MSHPRYVRWRGTQPSGLDCSRVGWVPVVSRRTLARPALPGGGTRGALVPGGAGEVVTAGTLGDLSRRREKSRYPFETS
jgi:hypothetical protein